MNEQRHIIKRQIIELEVQGEERAQQLQAQLSRIYRQRIVPLIDRYCTELSEPDRIHRIDLLEVDLGYVDPDQLEEELVAKLSVALRQALAGLISEQERSADRQSRSSKATSQLELFAFFARTGSLPWWVDASKPQLLDDCLKHLLRSAPEPLRRLARELFREQRPLQRIVYHYADELLSSLSGLLVPSLKRSLARHPQELLEVLQKTRGAAGSRPAHLRQSVWSNILHVASLEGEQFTAPGPFFREVLIRVATELGMPFDSLMSNIHQVLQEGRESIHTELKDTLESLYRERPRAETTDAEAIAQRLEQLQAAGGPLAGLWAALRALAHRLPASAQGELLTALRELESEVSTRPTAPPDVLQRILYLLRPVMSDQSLPAAVIRDWLTELQKLAAAGLFLEVVSELTQMLRETLNGTNIPQTEAETTVSEEIAQRLEQLQAAGGPLAGLWAVLRALAPRLPASAQGELLTALRELESDMSTSATIPRDTVQRILYLLLPVLADQSLPPAVIRDWLTELQKLASAGLFREAVSELTQILHERLNGENVPQTEAETTDAEAITQRLEQLQAAGGPLAGLWAALRALAHRLPASAQGELLTALRELESEVSTRVTAPPDVIQRILSLLRPVLADQSLPATVIRDWLTELQKLAAAGLSLEAVSELTQILHQTLNRENVPQTEAETTVSDDITQRLEQLQAAGGPLAGLWAALRALAPRLPASAQGELLTTLRELESEVSTRPTAPPDALQRILSLLRPVLADQSLPAAVIRDWLTELQKLAAAGLFREAVSELTQILHETLNGTNVLQTEAETTVSEDIAQRLEQLQEAGGPLSGLWAALLSLAPRLPASAQGELLTALRELESEVSTRPTAPPDVIQRILYLLLPVLADQSLPPAVIRDWLTQLQKLTVTSGLSPEDVSELTQMLRETLNGTNIPQTEAETTDAEAITQRLEQLQAAGGPLAGLWAVLRALAHRLPAPVQGELLTALKELESEVSTGVTAPPDALQRILYLLPPVLADKSLPPTVIRDWLPELRQMAADGLTPEKVSELTQMLSEALNGEDVPQIEAEETPVDLSFSDADELYIGNAGLVILWPFLGHFFARLDLLEEKQFKDAAAMQRAVGLLQVIATAEASFPEYLLPLNKVLCGMGLTNVFDFGPPLSESEAEECTDLLSAVIEQAPILRSMSVPGFRGTFLLRQGVLSAPDGAWLLRVERETYDIVLDRFPWGWGVVKLPWMESPLRVEW